MHRVGYAPPPEINPNRIENTTNPETLWIASMQNISTVIASVNATLRLVTPYLGANSGGMVRPKIDAALMIES